MEHRQAFVILNPAAAHGTAAKLFERFRKHPCIGRVEQTTASGSAETLVSEACSLGYGTLLACGGDGTVNGIVDALMRIPQPQRPALGILPAGTANDFARAVHHRDWKRVLDRALSGETRSVDVGVATGGFGRQHFLVAAFIGAPALVARRANKIGKPRRGLAGYLPYLREALTTSVAVDAEYDSETWSGDAVTILVSNTPNGAGGLKLCPCARMDDGRLDLLFVKHRRRHSMFVTVALDTMLVASLPFSRYRVHCPGVDAQRCTARRVTLHGEGVDLALDGEVVGQLPATIEIAPLALDVLYLER